jgi:superfamily II DNA or RNA helicase
VPDDPFTLRPYQHEGVGALRAAFAAGRKAPLYVLPTGGGKTRIFSYIVHGAASKNNTVVILAHRAEICDQISVALFSLGVAHGRISPRHNVTNDPVQVGMVQTVDRRLHKLPPPSLLVLDEAHHAVAGTWKKIRAAWSDAKVLGVTATPERLDGRGLGDVFDALVQGPPMYELIQGGFLSPFTYLAPKVSPILTGVHTVGGDYDASELEVIMNQRTITGDVIDHYREHLDGRPAIAFCATVKHAQDVAAQFSEAGYHAASIDGSMDKTERQTRLTGIGNGRLNVLTSCALISEGVDVPAVAAAILLRPTQSLAVYLQQIGRCLRPKPDGGRAVILDHVGNVVRHGLPDEGRAWSLTGKKRKPTETSLRTCELCYQVFPSATAKKACEEQGCGNPPEGADEPWHHEDCPILNGPPGASVDAPEEVDGTLVEIADPWLWLRPSGIDPARAVRAEFRALVALADSAEKLRMVARVLGYHPNCVRHVLASRR